MPKELNSVEDIDNMLDEEFEIVEEEITDDTNDNNEEEIEDNKTEENDDDEKGTLDQDNEEQNDDNDEKDDKKVDIESKKDYAFGTLRKENSELKKEKEQYEKDNVFVKELALQYGYSDVEKFKEDIRIAKLNQEAKSKGLDPEIYKQIDDKDRRIAALERERKEEKLLNKATAFSNSVENAVKEYNVEKTEIFNRLEKAGYDVDTILSLPNPEIVIKGVLVDKISDLSKQKVIKKQETLQTLADERHDSQGNEKSVSLDELIKQDMEEYKKANNL